VKYINERNKTPGLTYTLAVNGFADMTFEEFTRKRLMAPQDCSATSYPTEDLLQSTAALPSAIDWRNKGVVTRVKDQGNCGSCWTFSTTGSLESHWALKTGKLSEFSEQQLVDCAGAFNNKGCNGGLPSQAFEYVHYAGGIETEDSYPYFAKDGTCKADTTKFVGHVVRSYNITKGDEKTIHLAVATRGPVSICVDVEKDFMYYNSGVFSSASCQQTSMAVNHAILAVGYNTTASGVDYWIVKNSWGNKWGLQGYIWMLRGKNVCGLAECSAFPLV